MKADTLHPVCQSAVFLHYCETATVMTAILQLNQLKNDKIRGRTDKREYFNNLQL